MAVWLITGATAGLGAAVVNEVLRRGDKVVATGRKVEERLAHLKTSDSVALVELDVTAPLPEIKTQVDKAWAAFGHVDVLMNNAGMSAMKPAEEADVAFIKTMFEVNLFGQMRVTQAILPHLRAQGHGRIAFTSSSTLWAPLPFMSHYASSKAALSTYVEALHKELRPLGIQCVAIETGGLPTTLGQPRGGDAAGAAGAGFGAGGPSVEAYGPLFGALVGKMMKDPMAHMPGDVDKAAARVVDIAKREGAAGGKPWAVRVALGSDGMGSARQRCEEQLKLAETWRDVSVSTDREEGQTESVANREMFEFTTVLEK